MGKVGRVEGRRSEKVIQRRGDRYHTSLSPLSFSRILDAIEAEFDVLLVQCSLEQPISSVTTIPCPNLFSLNYPAVHAPETECAAPPTQCILQRSFTVADGTQRSNIVRINQRVLREFSKHGASNCLSIHGRFRGQAGPARRSDR